MSQPSAHPSCQPTSNPTHVINYNFTEVHSTSTLTSGPSGLFYAVSAVFKDLNINQPQSEWYLSIEVYSTGFASSIMSVTTIAANVVVNTQCTPGPVCAQNGSSNSYFRCASNIPMSPYYSTETGGSLTVVIVLLKLFMATCTVIKLLFLFYPSHHLHRNY